MMNTRLKRRFSSLLLVLALMLTSISVYTPKDSSAANIDSNATIVIACSDFQHPQGNAAGQTLVNNLISSIKAEGYTQAQGFLCCGDYSYNYPNSVSAEQPCVDALKSTITDNYGSNINMVLCQGNHDQVAIGSAGMSPSGNNDAANYGVFVINEDDYMWYNNDQSRIQQTAANLKSYLDAKRNAGYTKPIFVVSHLALNYSMRTRNDGDGQYANLIFDELNAAGAAGLNIIFLFGHNHSHGWDDYLGGAAVYQAKGTKLLVGNNSRTSYTEETLNFTYMNAGYVGYYYGSENERNAGADDTLTMTSFEIRDDKVIVYRYDANGVHNLKSSGVSNQSEGHNELGNGGYSPLTNTVASPAEITLNKTVTPAGTDPQPTTQPGPTGSGKVYEKVTSVANIQDGDKILMIYDGSDGGSESFMLPKSKEASNSSGTRVGFELENVDGITGATITGDYEAKEWTYTKSGSNWLLGDGSKYAKLTSTSNTGITATLETSGDAFTATVSNDKFNFQAGSNYLNYNSRGVINGYASKPAAFTLYRYTGFTVGGDPTSAPNPTTAPASATYTQVTAASQLQDNDKVLMIYNGAFSDAANNVYSEVAFMLPKSVSKQGSGSTRIGFDLDTNGVSTGSTITGDMGGKEWTFKKSGSGWLLSDGSGYAKLTSTSSNGITATFESTGDVFTIGGSAGDFTFTSGENALNWNKRLVVNGFSANQNPAGFYLYRLTSGSSSTPTSTPAGATPTPTTRPTATPTATVTTRPTATPDPSKKYGYKQVQSVSDLQDGDMVLMIYNGTFSDDTSTSEKAYMLPKSVSKEGSGSTRVGFDLDTKVPSTDIAITGDQTGKVWIFRKSGSGWMLSNGTGYAKLTNTSSTGVTATFETNGDVFTVEGSAGNFTFTVGDYALNWNKRILINGYNKNQNPAGFFLFRYTEITDADLATPTPAPTATPRATRTPRPTATPGTDVTVTPGPDASAAPQTDATPAPGQNATPAPGAVQPQSTTPPAGTADTPAASEATLKVVSIKCKANANKITGKLSLSKATIKIKVGKYKFKKAKVKGKKFTLKLGYKLKKKTKIQVKVTKKGYTAFKKTYKVK